MKTNLVQLNSDHTEQLERLFSQVFTDSEGTEEGVRIGALTRALATHIDGDRISCLGALGPEGLLGAIFFSELTLQADYRIQMLAPVAVATDRQSMGIGTELIGTGIEELKTRGVDFLVTYGDPKYYQRVGFTPLSERTIPAPHPLSMPFGWMSQPLSTVEPPHPIERTACVEMFNDPGLW